MPMPVCALIALPPARPPRPPARPRAAAGSGASAPQDALVGASEAEKREMVMAMLAQMQTRASGAAGAGAKGGGSGAGARPSHRFWETQPVPQFDAGGGEGAESAAPDGGSEAGPIDAPKTVADVRKHPLKLPPAFEWTTCDMEDPAVLEEVYTLLSLNYVEDDDCMFRFDYRAEFLRWALQPPGYYPAWHVGVRAATGAKKLVAFITAVPADMVVRGERVRMAEVNFLCVHKKLRAKRLAPVLIQEVTRRVNLEGIWQAAYTAGVVLPRPVATCRYWHRSLDPRKLIDVRFSYLPRNSTMARQIKLYKLPAAPLTPGFRRMEERDVEDVGRLLRAHLAGFKLAPHLSDEEVAHWMLPREGVIDSYVVQGEGGVVTDFGSFYTLPSSILGHPTHTELLAAYSYYNVANTVSLKVLMNDLLIAAKSQGYDVFNALDLMHNGMGADGGVLKELKFGIGDGNLQYYLYNWRTPQMEPSDVGLVLL